MAIIRILVLGVFVCYWAMTFLFTMPDNYINLQFHQGQQYFQFWLYQRWGFFAPPPNFDERLYYEFKDKHTQQVSLHEVLQPINEQKQAKAPFNWREDLLDYLLSGSVISIGEELISFKNDLRYQHEQQGDTNYDSSDLAATKQYIQSCIAFNTLRNYTRFVARKNDIDLSRQEVRMIFTRVYLPRFSERFSNAPRKEEYMFVSDVFTF